jgi:hypothetical protein
MSEFSGNFEFFCKPTKSAKTKETIIELTGNYELEDFCSAQEFWDQKVTLNIVKEELKGKAEPITVGGTVYPPKPNKGAKDTKTYTITITKTFDHDVDMELFKLLYQPVYIEWSKIQPDIDFNEPADPEEENSAF